MRRTYRSVYVATLKQIVNQYTITFGTDGGTKIQPITQDYNTTVTAPKNPTKTGYTFAGWDKAIPKTMPAENVTVKARWTLNTYQISFMPNGGKGTMRNQMVSHGVESELHAKQFTYEGHIFTGWNTKAAGSGTAYVDPSGVFLPSFLL